MYECTQKVFGLNKLPQAKQNLLFPDFIRSSGYDSLTNSWFIYINGEKKDCDLFYDRYAIFGEYDEIFIIDTWKGDVSHITYPPSFMFV